MSSCTYCRRPLSHNVVAQSIHASHWITVSNMVPKHSEMLQRYHFSVKRINNALVGAILPSSKTLSFCSRAQVFGKARICWRAAPPFFGTPVQTAFLHFWKDWPQVISGLVTRSTEVSLSPKTIRDCTYSFYEVNMEPSRFNKRFNMYQYLQKRTSRICLLVTLCQGNLWPHPYEATGKYSSAIYSEGHGESMSIYIKIVWHPTTFDDPYHMQFVLLTSPTVSSRVIFVSRQKCLKIILDRKSVEH